MFVRIKLFLLAMVGPIHISSISWSKSRSTEQTDSAGSEPKVSELRESASTSKSASIALLPSLFANCNSNSVSNVSSILS